MNSKKVSIIIPLYNCEKFIAQTIKSAINQKYKNKEIIIIDDGSEDNSLNVARKFESENTKVFTQKHSGACSARNFGFEKSTGLS